MTENIITCSHNTEYVWNSANETPAHAYTLPTVIHIIRKIQDRRIFDLGCGNGSTARQLSDLGWSVCGVDSSNQGIRHCVNTKSVRIEYGSAYDELHLRFGTFPCVISLDVIEHLYSPRDFAKTAYKLLKPGGILVISTPYHGYLKNLMLAVTGKMDAHFTALWDHGHIKFWSRRTLGLLLSEAGFSDIRFHRVGRIPVLAKAMIAVAHRPIHT